MSIHILIVEDHPTNLKLASQVLEMESYVVAQAADAEQAQELLAKAPPPRRGKRPRKAGAK